MADSTMDTLANQRNTVRKLHHALNYFFAIAVFIAGAFFVAVRQPRSLDFSGIIARSGIIRAAFFTTVQVSFIALVGSVTLGLVFYFFSISKSGFLKAFTNVFTEVIYGTPLLVMIFMMGYPVRASLNIATSPTMGLVGLTIYITPYMTNIFKAAFSSIPEEQYMAMELFGFNAFQRYRYIIIPQVIRVLTAPLMNNFSLIIKGSALLNIVATREIYYELFSWRQFTGRSFEAFVVMWGLYLAITLPLSQLTKYIERRWSR
ncbi:MAG: ABC transporter permease subunit [Acholeplasmatales bacterium]|nr:MAG: ABC transporter permease subunit [Acholeplasmatales bacterium]